MVFLRSGFGWIFVIVVVLCTTTLSHGFEIKGMRPLSLDQHARQKAYRNLDSLIPHEPISSSNTSIASMHSPMVNPTRRNVLTSVMVGVATGGIATGYGAPIAKSHAASLLDFSNSNDHRQLELCLVSVLRVVYWAHSLSRRMATNATMEEQRQLYLEARLGCKSVLTGKLGGGSNNQVYILSTLQLTGCLKDLEYYANQESAIKGKRMNELRRVFTEDIAAVVEFDGMDMLTDPSPRSSLTLSQYTKSKSDYVRRVLAEKVVPDGLKLTQLFPTDALQRSQSYIQQYYPREIPLIAE
jgi:hypothetical protein